MNTFACDPNVQVVHFMSLELCPGVRGIMVEKQPDGEVVGCRNPDGAPFTDTELSEIGMGARNLAVTREDLAAYRKFYPCFTNPTWGVVVVQGECREADESYKRYLARLSGVFGPLSPRSVRARYERKEVYV